MYILNNVNQKLILNDTAKIFLNRIREIGDTATLTLWKKTHEEQEKVGFTHIYEETAKSIVEKIIGIRNQTFERVSLGLSQLALVEFEEISDGYSGENQKTNVLLLIDYGPAKSIPKTTTERSQVHTNEESVNLILDKLGDFFAKHSHVIVLPELRKMYPSARPDYALPPRPFAAFTRPRIRLDNITL